MSGKLDGIAKLIEDGGIVDASTKLREHLSSQPDDIKAYLLLAKIAKMIGNLELAGDLLAKALKTAPAAVHVLLAQGDVMMKLGREPEALRCFAKVLEIDSSNGEAHMALGRHYAGNFSFKEALHHLQLAAAVNPTLEVNSLLGHVLVGLGRFDEAENVFQACLELDPSHGDTLVQLGSICLRRSDVDRAWELYRLAQTAIPGHPEALWNLGYICLNTSEPITSCKDWLDLTPAVLSKMVFALNYQSDLDRDLIAAAHREWGLDQTKHIPHLQLPNRRPSLSGGRLRLGFVSGDFCHHPVGRFAALLFAHLNRQKFDLYIYDNGSPTDPVTERLRSLVSNWSNIFERDDDEAARLIADDHIDVLIDLSGHTVRNRLLVFARRPAPVQITMFAYPNTTGLRAIDYRITDPFADPPGLTEHLYAEKSIRLSRTAWVYWPPDAGIEPYVMPTTPSERFVFGCLNNPQKISPASIDLWSALLRSLPQCRLLMLTLDQTHAQKARRKFAEQSVAQDQLWLVPKTDPAGYLKYHQHIDMMLDPLPYNGGVTTCDALWMGVPVLTLAGDSYVSRQGVSILNNVGLSEFIAANPEDFLNRAREWVASRERLAAVRCELRAGMKQSPLLDYVAYAEELGGVFEKLVSQLP